MNFNLKFSIRSSTTVFWPNCAISLAVGHFQRTVHELDSVFLEKRTQINATQHTHLRFICSVESMPVTNVCFFFQVLSDNTLVNLVPGGADKFVDYEDRIEYIKMVRNCRMAEGKVQV